MCYDVVLYDVGCDMMRQRVVLPHLNIYLLLHKLGSLSKARLKCNKKSFCLFVNWTVLCACIMLFLINVRYFTFILLRKTLQFSFHRSVSFYTGMVRIRRGFLS